MKKYLFTLFAFVCIAATGIILTSCVNDGMDDENLLYSYVAHSQDFNYGPFEKAIKEALGGAVRVPGGNDDKVKEACDKCYEEMKAQIKDKSGTVFIYKRRYPDGKQIIMLMYNFE